MKKFVLIGIFASCFSLALFAQQVFRSGETVIIENGSSVVNASAATADTLAATADTLAVAAESLSVDSVIAEPAPQPLTPQQQINAIKMDMDTYLFAESTTESWESALENAKFLLNIEIENFIKSLGLKDSVEGFVARTSNKMMQLQSMRGSRYRAFIYVKKSEIVPYLAGEEVVYVSTDAHSQITPFDPAKAAAEKAAAEKAAAEQAAAEQSAAEKAAAEQARLDSIKAAEEAARLEAAKLTDMERDMLAVTAGADIGAFVMGLSNNNAIQAYGKFRDMPENVDCLLFVYNRDKEIVAYLRKTGNTYFNLQTKQTDSITNYKGCGAIWFQPK